MRKKNVLGLSFGRRLANTDIMVKTALMECEKAGCEVRFIRVDELEIKPCTGCISCVVGMTTGRGKGGCPIKDDFYILDEALMACDAVIVGSPAYVLSPTGRFRSDLLTISHSEKRRLRKDWAPEKTEKSCRMREALKREWAHLFPWAGLRQRTGSPSCFPPCMNSPCPWGLM